MYGNLQPYNISRLKRGTEVLPIYQRCEHPDAPPKGANGSATAHTKIKQVVKAYRSARSAKRRVLILQSSQMRGLAEFELEPGGCFPRLQHLEMSSRMAY